MDGALRILLIAITSLIDVACSANYVVSSTSSGAFTSPAYSYSCNPYNCNPYTCGANTCYNTCYQTCYHTSDRRDQLTAEAGHRVVLVVQSSGGGCDDRLEAYEGVSTGGTRILDQCCNGYTGLTISTGNQMYFRFVNNGDGDNVHFTIRYFGFDPTGNPTAGQTIFASQTPTYGSLYSESFPTQYTANENKFWILKAPYQSYIITGALFFSDFHNCNDKLILRDGRYSSSSVLIQYCTSLTSNPDTSTFTSTQQYIYVEMSLTSGTAHYGFGLRYTWTENPGFTYITTESPYHSTVTSLTAYRSSTDLVLQTASCGSTYSRTMCSTNILVIGWVMVNVSKLCQYSS